MDFALYWFMFPVSIVVATCALLSGIGGAALFTPIFILVFPLLGPEYALNSTIAAISAALITQTFGFFSGFVGYYHRRLIDYALAYRILIFAAPISVVGALVANLVHDSVLLMSYSILVAVIAVVIGLNRLSASVKSGVCNQPEKTIIDSRGHEYTYKVPRLGVADFALTGLGAFLTGMVSVGIGEVTVSKLMRKGLPIAVAAATSVVVVIVTVASASITLAVQLIEAGGWPAVPWNLLVYNIPGVLIGGQIGPRLQGKIAPQVMRRAIAILFVVLAIAMTSVAIKKFGV